MKSLFSLIALFVLFTINSLAQITVDTDTRDDGTYEINIQANVDSSTYDSLRSRAYSLVDFDGSTEYFTVFYDIAAGTGSPNIHVNIMAAEDGTAYYSLEQLVDTTTSTTPTWLATNLSNKRPKYVKFDIEQVDTTAAGSINFIFRAVLKDPAVQN